MKPEQTAVEWLVEQTYLISSTKWPDIIEQAKAMEREQHGHTWDEALIQVDKRGGVILRALVDFDTYWPNKNERN
jgi:hypothetical protein